MGQAQYGDEAAFRDLVEAHRHELHVHCYRILGSFQDAEDALQETLLAAWQALDKFEGRSSIRTWLYRVATNRCLNMLRSSGTARVRAASSMQHAELPPRQRAVQILRDVLGFHATEVAQMLDSTEESVTSALKRARATLQSQLARSVGAELPSPHSAAESALVERFTRAFVSDRIQDLVDLLTEDVVICMPPLPFEWQGRGAARQVLLAVLRPGRRLLLTRANGQPAFGLYLPDPDTDALHAIGMLVLTLSAERVSAITNFELGTLAPFGLPHTLRS